MKKPRFAELNYQLYRLHAVLCLISYGYDSQHSNKAEYLWVKTKTDVGM
jgi:hypothetical protein